MGIHVTVRAFGALMALVLVGSFVYGPAPATGGTPVGAIARIQGGAMIQQAGTAGFAPLNEGQAVNVGDVIATDAEQRSRIWWHGSLPFEADASLGHYTSLGFVKYEQSGSASAFLAQLGQGVARFVKVLPKTSPPSSFMIFTPTALIEVVPNDDRADFVVEVRGETRTTVTCIWGEIRVKNISDRLVGARHITACRKVTIEQNKEPFRPVGVSTAALRQLIRQTTMQWRFSRGPKETIFLPLKCPP